MKHYFIRQLILIIPTLFLVTIISFSLIRLMPADAVDTYMITHHMAKNQQNIELAEESGMVLLATKKRMYEACGILYSNGLVGNKVRGAST